MAELGVKCPVCGMPLRERDEEELAKELVDHAKHEHGMEMPLERATEKIRMENPGK